MEENKAKNMNKKHIKISAWEQWNERLSIGDRSRLSSLALRYGIAVVAVAAASVLRFILDPLLDDTAQFITFFAAIVLTGAIGGRNAAGAATILSTLSVFFFFIWHHAHFEEKLLADLTAMGLFFFTGLFISWIAGRMFDARESAVHELTERRNTEKELRAAKEEWERTFDSVPDLITILDRDHHIVRVNRAMADRLGLTPEECVNQACHECVHGLSKPPEHCPHDLLLLDGREHTAEVHEERLGGDFLVTVTPLLDEDGRPMGAVHIARDITEQKRIEEALRANENRFRSIFENAAVGMSLVDGQGNWLLVNDTFYRMVGYSREAIIDSEFSTLTHPDDMMEDRDRYRQLMNGEMDSYILEKRYVRKDGQTIWVLLNRALVRDAAGKPAYSIAVVVDITHRKQMEETLRESESFYRQTLESIPGMVFTTRPDGYCDYQSRPWEEFTGIPTSEHLGDGWNKLLHPDDRARAFAAWRAAVEERANYDLEYRVRRYDGEYRWFRVLGRPILNDEGQIVRWFGTALDIEEIKHAEEALRQFNEELEARVTKRTAELKKANEELIRSNRELEQFAYVSSHDLQEPLRMVASFVGLLEQEYKGKLDKTADEYIAFAIEGAKRMQRLILDLLKFSRVRTQGKTFTLVEGEQVLAQALQNLKIAIEETGARITHEPLPQICGDETQLVQVFQNLIGNAIKFRKPGTVPEVHIYCRPDNHSRSWVFGVRDNGIGIAQEHHEKVFVIFRRLHTRTQYEGTGIGLAIVKRIIERHGGQVCVESMPEKGSVFYFTLPIEGQEPNESF